ncbi:MAG: methyltransferase [Bryobacterales bacterium]|nr:methyltransferase [Bryobacterales bacterium]
MDLASSGHTGLPDMNRLEALPAKFWSLFQARLDALGVDEETIRRFDFLGPDLGDTLRLPLQQWLAREEGSLNSLAVAFLRLQEQLSWNELQQVFGGVLAAEMRSVGLAFATLHDQFGFSLRLGALGGRWILSDRHLFHPDAVMGSSAATSRIYVATAEDATPWPGDGALLDLGCGGGALALALQPTAARVAGCDISARAIALARINVMLNGLREAQALAFREGDLFAPCSGERYSRIVCQPPFIPDVGLGHGATFASGGALGDAVTLRILRELTAHLAPGGRAVLCVEWAGGEADSWRRRVLQALEGQPLLGIHCEMFRTPMEDYCALLAPYLHPPASSSYGEFLKGMLAHYRKVGIDAIDLVMHFLELDEESSARHAVRQVPLASLDHVSAGFADAAFHALRIAYAPDEAFRKVTLRAPSGFRLLAQDDDTADTVNVEFGPGALLPGGQLPAQAASILALAGDGAELGEVVSALDGTAESNEGLIRQMLAQGLLYAA